VATVLVVANETLGGKRLIDAVRARADKGDARFVVIAPQNRPKAGMVVYNESVRDAAQHRVDQTLRQLADVGIEATGEVMDPDPYAAVTDAVREFAADEIIISTHPETRSGWMRRDLIDRVRADTGLPVEHVIVDLDADRQEVTHTLVVANQTLGGDPLHDLLKAKAAEGPHRFTVIVPLSGGEGHHSVETRERLDALLDRLKDEGLVATGALGDPDPFTAIMNALQFYAADEIVISTFPETRSGWLRGDLVERVRRATATPVEHVVSDVAAERAGTS
jgi:hypothetical protein